MLSLTTRIENGFRGEDRIAHRRTRGGTLLVVADGAGGVGGAAAAAQHVCESIAARADDARGNVDFWVRALREEDAVLARSAHGGLTTAVIVEVHDSRVLGASVGDSGALMISATGIVELTEFQHRKPLLGSGMTRPVAFGPLPISGRLLVATDGLLKYASLERVAWLCRSLALGHSADALLQSVRLSSGAYHDDVAFALAEWRASD